MPFHPPRFPTTRPLRGAGPVLSIGRRVFVNCPRDGAGRVLLADDAGRTEATSLADGAEVEILAWRPRGSGGTRYRVHSMRDGLEGWLAAENLRACRLPVSPESPLPATPPRAQAGDTRRRFGQRSDGSR